MQKKSLSSLVLAMAFPLLLSGCLFGSGGGEESAALRSTMTGQPMPYSVEFTLEQKDQGGEAPNGAVAVSGNAGDGSGTTGATKETGESSRDEDTAEVKQNPAAAKSTEDQSILLSTMRNNSQLVYLRDDPPDGRVGLQRRVLEDLETAEKVLRSYGYYNGTVRRHIDWDKDPVQVVLEFRPGTQYKVGTVRLRYSGAQPYEGTPPTEDEAHLHGRDFMLAAPENLDDFGLPSGTPASAARVTDAVDSVPALMHNQGYPFAKVLETRYVIDRSTCTLDADVTIETGPLLRMGGEMLITETGPEAPSVDSEYLHRLITWVPGQYWNDALLLSYRTRLQETGLFSSIDIKPEMGAAEQNSKNSGTDNAALEDVNSKVPKGKIVPLALKIQDGPPHTVSGGLLYTTDHGPGVKGTWEHRNFFGAGEQLRLSAPISADEQRFTATFRKPEFLRKDQAFVAELDLLNETTDAYDQTAAYIAAGLERRLSGDWRNWWVSGRVSLEGGSLTDSDGEQTYMLLGVPMAVKRDTTNDMFNPTKGTRLSLAVTPYTGSYKSGLTILRARLDASAYWSPFAGDRLVFAARAGVGSLSGADLDEIPASLRFYAGGGGSVRGYDYQSLGPKDKDGDPVGGLSFNDVGLEARIRITENFGIVPFIDGGMVYDKTLPDWGRDMSFGVGLGFRYYTAIGPLRLDIATPLQDRDDNKSFQIYLSIGQAF